MEIITDEDLTIRKKNLERFRESGHGMCQIGSDLKLTIGMLFVREIPLLLIGGS